MRGIVYFLSTALLLAVTGTANAHDEKLHRGKAIEGEVLSMSSDGFELKTEDDSLAVVVTDKTKFERGNSIISLADVTEGMKVKIFGTKLPGGKLAAKEVLLFSGSSDAKNEETHSGSVHERDQ